MSADKGREKCSSCPDDADAECTIWGARLCGTCAKVWDLEAPTQEQALRKYPLEAERMAAFKAFTSAWVAKRKQRARAA